MPTDIIAIDDATLESMRAIVAYNLPDEEHDAAICREENGDDEGHIVHDLRRVNEFLRSA
jgi:hypothetical protein